MSMPVVVMPAVVAPLVVARLATIGTLVIVAPTPTASTQGHAGNEKQDSTGDHGNLFLVLHPCRGGANVEIATSASLTRHDAIRARNSRRRVDATARYSTDAGAACAELVLTVDTAIEHQASRD